MKTRSVLSATVIFTTIRSVRFGGEGDDVERSAALHALNTHTHIYIYSYPHARLACIMCHGVAGVEEDLTGKRKPIKRYDSRISEWTRVGRGGVRAAQYDSLAILYTYIIWPDGDGQSGGRCCALQLGRREWRV